MFNAAQAGRKKYQKWKRSKRFGTFTAIKSKELKLCKELDWLPQHNG